MSAAEILNVLDVAAEAQKRARNTHCKTGASEFTKWVVECLATPCKSGAVYKWTKGRCKQPPSTVESPLYKGPVQCPKKVMAHRRMQWQDVWGDQPTRLLPTVELMKELRDEAIQERLDLIDLACFDEAVFSFNDATALGLDCIAPRVLKSLPHNASWDIVGLLNECEAKQAWPWQMLGQLLVLIGKETGGVHVAPSVDALPKEQGCCLDGRSQRALGLCGEELVVLEICHFTETKNRN